MAVSTTQSCKKVKLTFFVLVFKAAANYLVLSMIIKTYLEVLDDELISVWSLKPNNNNHLILRSLACSQVKSLVLSIFLIRFSGFTFNTPFVLKCEDKPVSSKWCITAGSITILSCCFWRT